MAAAFWTLEDGRTFARRWALMVYMLELITDELKNIEGAGCFHDYLERLVFREENGDIPNGHGGFIRGDEDMMFNFDLRTFAPANRTFFWKAAQTVLAQLKTENKESEYFISSFTLLLDMHKRIKKGENPMKLNDLNITYPKPNEKLGPGW